MPGRRASAHIAEKTLPLPEGELRYVLAVPPDDRLDHPVPLILALHYGWPTPGPPPPFYGRGVLLGLVRPALLPLNALIAAPDCPGRDWTDPRSEAAVLQLLDHLERVHPVDRERVLLVGYSLGGIGTWYLAGRHPERFSAAIPISTVPYEEALDRIEGLPLYVIHARQDELMPLPLVEQAVNRLRTQGIAVELVVLEGVTHFETARFVEPLRRAVPWVRAIWGEGQG